MVQGFSIIALGTYFKFSLKEYRVPGVTDEWDGTEDLRVVPMIYRNTKSHHIGMGIIFLEEGLGKHRYFLAAPK